MIRHIVMFKLKDTGDSNLLETNKNELKKRLEALPGKIPVVRDLEVGINVSESERAFDIVLVSGFDSLEDLETYRVHPAHQDLISYLTKIRDKTAAVDYII